MMSRSAARARDGAGAARVRHAPDHRDRRPCPRPLLAARQLLAAAHRAARTNSPCPARRTGRAIQAPRGSPAETPKTRPRARWPATRTAPHPPRHTGGVQSAPLERSWVRGQLPVTPKVTAAGRAVDAQGARRLAAGAPTRCGITLALLAPQLRTRGYI